MFLQDIVSTVDQRVQRLHAVRPYLVNRAQNMPAVRSLESALAPTGAGLRVIAECKHRSPSKGWLTDAYDPVRQALSYEEGGAAAISVLTEPHFFAGDRWHLLAVTGAVEVPVLRKDFIRDPVQLYESRALGADAVLLIVRIIDDRIKLKDLWQVATGIGLEVLVEVHARAEVEAALEIGAHIIGVNNRDLDSFETRLGLSQEVAEMLPSSVIKVAESGIQSMADAINLRGFGYEALLIGETLMRGGFSLKELTHVPRG